MDRSPRFTDRAILSLGLLILISLSGTSCSLFGSKGTATPRPRQVSFLLRASSGVNECTGLTGNPVQVRVYLLNRDLDLEMYGLASLWADPGPILSAGGKLIEEETLLPEETKRVRIESPAELHVLLVLGGFCESAGSCWYFKSELDDLPKEALALQLVGSCIEAVQE